MARRTTVVTIDDKDSRDHGRSYFLTEMPCEQAEWWAVRAMQGILGTGGDVNFNSPLGQLAGHGIMALASIPDHLLKPLLDEMMSCVRVQLPGNGGNRPLLADDIEEIRTRFELRAAVFELLTGFSLRGDQSTGQ